MTLHTPAYATQAPSATRRAAVALGVWAAWYAAYRFYYGLGGQPGMTGRLAPPAHFRRDNLIGGAIILLAAVLPPIAVSAWRHRPVRRHSARRRWDRGDPLLAACTRSRS